MNSEIKLGIIGAMEQEVETLLSVMEDKASTPAAPFTKAPWKDCLL